MDNCIQYTNRQGVAVEVFVDIDDTGQPRFVNIKLDGKELLYLHMITRSAQAVFGDLVNQIMDLTEKLHSAGTLLNMASQSVVDAEAESLGYQKELKNVRNSIHDKVHGMDTDSTFHRAVYLENALTELVALKDMKDMSPFITFPEYVRRKPLAWTHARKLLAEIDKSKKKKKRASH